MEICEPFLRVIPLLVVTLLPPKLMSFPTASNHIVRVAFGVEATIWVAVVVTVIAVEIMVDTFRLWVVPCSCVECGQCNL